MTLGIACKAHLPYPWVSRFAHCNSKRMENMLDAALPPPPLDDTGNAWKKSRMTGQPPPNMCLFLNKMCAQDYNFDAAGSQGFKLADLDAWLSTLPNL